MNFREHFEAWHKATYGFVGNYTGTALNVFYRTSTVQARWEGWQACADWHTQQEIQKQWSEKK